MEDKSPYKDRLSYWEILKNKRALNSVLLSVFTLAASLVLDPVLAIRLTNMELNE